MNEAIVAEADRNRIFCVRADIAIDGSAVTPASFEYAGLSVGVLAGGEHRRSAGIRSAIREALQQGVISPESFESDDVVRGGVALIGGGPGDPELITVRGRRLLAQADVVVADRLAPPELLAELAPNVEVIDAAKIPVRPGDGPGRHQRGDDRPGPGRSLRGAAQGRRPVRVRPRLRGSAGVRRRRRSR